MKLMNQVYSSSIINSTNTTQRLGHTHNLNQLGFKRETHQKTNFLSTKFQSSQRKKNEKNDKNVSVNPRQNSHSFNDIPIHIPRILYYKGNTKEVKPSHSSIPNHSKYHSVNEKEKKNITILFEPKKSTIIAS